ncbi:MAG: hypothetical protein E6G75_25015 [Alphaproteobacteria bacterium]|nr:MAG: hypothetical protein E6G75_25015 [Alphaproteobacteria bacterium]
MPLASTRQEKLAGRPATTSSTVSAASVSVERASQTRVGGQRLEQSVRPRQAVGDPRDLLGRQEQQSVAFEEAAALRLANCPDDIGAALQDLGELGRCLLDQFRRRRVDHGEDFPLREGGHVLRRPLRPGQLLRDQLVDVGLDGEMPRGVDGGCRRQDEREREDPPRVPGAEIDDSDDGGLQHRMGISGRIRIRLSGLGSSGERPMKCIWIGRKGNQKPRAFSPCGPVESPSRRNAGTAGQLPGCERCPPDAPRSRRVGFGRARTSLPQSRHTGEPPGFKVYGSSVKYSGSDSGCE